MNSGKLDSGRLDSGGLDLVCLGLGSLLRLRLGLVVKIEIEIRPRQTDYSSWFLGWFLG